MSPNLRFLVPTTVSLWDAEKVNGWFLHVWFPPLSMEEEVWWCGGALMVTVDDLFRIQATFNQHGSHSILQRYAIPSGLHFVGPSFVFQQDNDAKHTSRLCKGYLTKKESVGILHQKTWSPQSLDLNPIEMVWNELTAEWRKGSQQVLSIYGNSFKTVGKAFQVTTSWSWLRECQECAKLSSRQRVATSKNLKYKICFDLFHTFLVMT